MLGFRTHCLIYVTTYIKHSLTSISESSKFRFGKEISIREQSLFKGLLQKPVASKASLIQHAVCFAHSVSRSTRMEVYSLSFTQLVPEMAEFLGNQLGGRKSWWIKTTQINKGQFTCGMDIVTLWFWLRRPNRPRSVWVHGYEIKCLLASFQKDY